MYLVGWAVDVIATLYGRNCSRHSKVDDQTLQRRWVVLSTLFQRYDNVIYIYVVITSMTRRCKHVVFIDETSWLDCRCDYDVAWISNFHVLITLITRRCDDVGFGCRLDFNVVAT